MSALPVIDIAPLLTAGQDRQAVAGAIGAACREHGFFYVSGHGVPPALIARLDAASRRFFARCPSPSRTRSPWSAAAGRGGATSRRRRADLGAARPEGGRLLRGRGAHRAPCRCTGRTCSPPRCPSCATRCWSTCAR
ncbi:2-oxoglutarate and iron-dependent oxygenase domain-containing protein [Nonomuraea rubra]|uniref:2-oxoglutarate and iron-dependent oxygenase domain-containing protein n=1 Tax=Nonomuraea rubra TaxID=46180 RepID=UPI003CD05B3C